MFHENALILPLRAHRRIRRCSGCSCGEARPASDERCCSAVGVFGIASAITFDAHPGARVSRLSGQVTRAFWEGEVPAYWCRKFRFSVPEGRR